MIPIIIIYAGASSLAIFINSSVEYIFIRSCDELTVDKSSVSAEMGAEKNVSVTISAMRLSAITKTPQIVIFL